MKAARLSSDHVVRKSGPARGRPAASKVVRLEEADFWARSAARSRLAAAQRQEAAGRGAEAAEAGARSDKEVRLSLRLDGEAHRRLKLVAACRRQSLQDVLASAVERYLRDTGPETLNELTALLAGDRGEEA